MRFPLALTAKIAGHIIKHKVARTPKFAMVLQLEPLLQQIGLTAAP